MKIMPKPLYRSKTNLTDMAEIQVTTMSSKGQVVIPWEMRKGFHEREKFVIIKVGKQLILKTVRDFDENIEEDLEFARRTEEAFERYEAGEFRSMSEEDFLKEIERW